MRAKQTSWKNTDTNSKASNIFAKRTPWVRHNGVWVKEGNPYGENTALQLSIQATSATTVSAYWEQLVSTSAITIKTYNSAGAVTGTTTLTKGVVSSGTIGIPAGSVLLRVESATPITSTTTSTTPLYFSSNAVIKSIDFISSTLWKLKAYPITQSSLLLSVPATLPAGITTLAAAFQYCGNFNQDISGWDTKDVTDMSYMFRYTNKFVQNVSGWNVTKVTNWVSFNATSALVAANIPAKFR